MGGDMQIVQGDQVAPAPAVRHRGGALNARILLEGRVGAPGNFQLSLGLTGVDFVSPRHRHNFEQYRIVLEGSFDFGRDGVMAPGMVAYFPEGVFYGPQTSGPDTVAAVLQFGGVSGNGYLSAAQVSDGMTALLVDGDFQKGVYRRRDDVPGRRNQDAFEAIWEYVKGRTMTYPASAFSGPVISDPGLLEWAAIGGAAGVWEKALAGFAGAQTAVRLLRLAPGAGLDVRGRGVFLVLSGGGTVAGQAARRLTAFELEAGEAAALAADEEMTVVHYALPVFADEEGKKVKEGVLF
jgi:hypothetical protein